MTESKALKWKKLIVFFAVSSVLISAMLFIRLAFFSGTKGIAGKETAILNPKYENDLSEFLLKSGSAGTAQISHWTTSIRRTYLPMRI